MVLLIMNRHILPPGMFLHLLSSDVLIKHKTLLKYLHKLLLVGNALTTAVALKATTGKKENPSACTFCVQIRQE